LYYGGKVSFHQSPHDKSQTHYDYIQAQKSAYKDAGKKFPIAEEREIVVTGKLTPVYDPQFLLDPKMINIPLPQRKFDHLTSANLAHSATKIPLTLLTFSLDTFTQARNANESPEHYLRRLFRGRQNKKFLLRETLASETANISGEPGKATGHYYITRARNFPKTFSSWKIITVNDLLNLCEKDAQRAGYPDTQTMWEHFHGYFIDSQVPEPGEQKILLFNIEKVQPRNWHYASLKPEAAISYNQQPVLPITRSLLVEHDFLPQVERG
jgi:hypothetical protein